MIPKIVHLFACFYGATAVILGALGAHWLKTRLDSLQLESFKTGVHYQLIHAVVLLIAGFYAEKMGGRLFNSAVACFILGIFFFSGSIYILSTKVIWNIQTPWWLGPITPLGGLLLIVGWILFALAYKN